MSLRTSLLLNCSEYEAQEIRRRAEKQRCRVSGYVLNIVMRSVDFDEQLAIGAKKLHPIPRTTPEHPRKTVHLHCSTLEAKSIRKAAETRETTISGFILNALRRSWFASDSFRLT